MSGTDLNGFYAPQKNSNAPKDLQTDWIALEVYLNSNISGAIAHLQSEINTINGEITTINSTLSSQASAITTLQGQVTTLIAQMLGTPFIGMTTFFVGSAPGSPVQWTAFYETVNVTISGGGGGFSFNFPAAFHDGYNLLMEPANGAAGLSILGFLTPTRASCTLSTVVGTAMTNTGGTVPDTTVVPITYLAIGA